MTTEYEAGVEDGRDQAKDEIGTLTARVQELEREDEIWDKHSLTILVGQVETLKAQLATMTEKCVNAEASEHELLADVKHWHGRWEESQAQLAAAQAVVEAAIWAGKSRDLLPRDGCLLALWRKADALAGETPRSPTVTITKRERPPLVIEETS